MALFPVQSNSEYILAATHLQTTRFGVPIREEKENFTVEAGLSSWPGHIWSHRPFYIHSFAIVNLFFSYKKVKKAVLAVEKVWLFQMRKIYM